MTFATALPTGQPVPTTAEAWHALGNAYVETHQYALAQSAYESALAMAPNHPVVLGHLAMALRLQGQLEQALSVALNTLADHPQSHKAALEACNVYHLQGNEAKAMGVLEHARAAGVFHLDLNDKLAYYWAKLGKVPQAIALLEATCQQFPQAPMVFKNLGSLYLMQNEPDLARNPLQQATLLAPQNAEICHAMGLFCLQTSAFSEAKRYFEAAVTLAPANADYQVSLAQWELQHGDYAQGWPRYDWRLKRDSHAGLSNLGTTPPWQGDDLGSQTLLLHAEQGLGDTLQFVRFVQPLARLYPQAQLVVQVPPTLVKLLKQSALPVSHVIATADPRPEFDVHLPLMSLPNMGPWHTPDTWPSTPYLMADIEDKIQWRKRLGALEKLPKIGLAWTGRKTHGFNTQRSLTPQALGQLFGLSQVHWVSLQPGQSLPVLPPPHWHDWTQDLTDFAETAALIEGLDAVVTIDTSVAHLAGALGKPVWLLLDASPDWRWGLDTSHTPWYPNTRLLRQSASQDWSSVIDTLHQALIQSFPNLENAPMSLSPTQTQGLKLNMGCGQNKKAGYINVDKYGDPEVRCDLEVFPWPWADNSVGEMVFNHVLEHLGETSQVYLNIFKEIYRVCHDGATIKIVVPHPRHDDFLHDPTHVRAVTIDGLRQFSKAANRYWKDNGYANTTLGLYLDVDFEITEAVHMPAEPWKTRLANGEMTSEDLSDASRQYNNVIKEIHVTLKVCKG